MKNLFSKDNLSLMAQRNEGTIHLTIQSDFSGARKSQLRVNEKAIALELESFWKKLKSLKIKGLYLEFDPVDWYDDLTNVYETPNFSIQRGLRKTKVTHHEHGAIPKDWAVVLTAVLTSTNAIGPFMEIIDGCISRHLDAGGKKELEKKLRPVLQGKEKTMHFSVESEG